jgi:RNA polymerase sigma factor (sigma-70 family)
MLNTAEEVHLGAMVRAWQDHAGGPDMAPPRVKRCGMRARDRIVRANLRLVASIAEKRPSTVPLEDRMQAGTIGLVRAAEKFDPSRGYKFSTYAFAWIRQAMVKAIDDALLIHVPCNVTGALRGTVNGKVSANQIASGLRVWLGVASLDSPIKDTEGQSLIDVVPAPFDATADNDDLQELRQRLSKLDPVSYRIVSARWFANPAVTFAEIAAAEGIEQCEVRTLLRYAETELRGNFTKKRKARSGTAAVRLCVLMDGTIHNHCGQWLGKAASQQEAERYCVQGGWRYEVISTGAIPLHGLPAGRRRRR